MISEHSAATAGAVTAGVLAQLFVVGSALPFFGVSVTTLGMAAAGSLIAFAYAKPLKSAKQVYGYAVGGMLLGVWAVQILPGWLGWEWYMPSMQPPMAGVVAFVSRWAVPVITQQLPSLWQRVFNTGGTPPNGA